MKLTYFLVTAIAFHSISALAQYDFKDIHNADDGYYNIGRDSVALDGYDPVEYFKSNMAVRGNKEYMHIYKGIKYMFRDEFNKVDFKAAPKKYLPAYGGYCAYGLGMNVDDGMGSNKPGKYPVNPKSFKIIDGRLYLFYDNVAYHALKHWNKNEEQFLKNANERWEIINKLK